MLPGSVRAPPSAPPLARVRDAGGGDARHEFKRWVASWSPSGHLARYESDDGFPLLRVARTDDPPRISPAGAAASGSEPLASPADEAAVRAAPGLAARDRPRPRPSPPTSCSRTRRCARSPPRQSVRRRRPGRRARHRPGEARALRLPLFALLELMGARAPPSKNPSPSWRSANDPPGRPPPAPDPQAQIPRAALRAGAARLRRSQSGSWPRSPASPAARPGTEAARRTQVTATSTRETARRPRRAARLESRVLVDSTQISPSMRHAIVAIEDKRFWEHRRRRPARDRARASGRTSAAGASSGRLDDHAAVRQERARPRTSGRSRASCARPRSPGSSSSAWTKDGSSRVPEHDLLRERRLRDPAGGARLLRPRREGPDAPEAALLAGIPADPSLYDPVAHPRAAPGRGAGRAARDAQQR